MQMVVIRRTQSERPMKLYSIEQPIKRYLHNYHSTYTTKVIMLAIYC